MAHENPVPIPGSERSLMPGTRVLGPADPNQRIEVTVLVRPRAPIPSGDPREQSGERLPHERRYLTREEFAAAYGADPADVTALEAFAREHNLSVAEVRLPQRSIVLAGTVAEFSQAFGVKLERCECPQGAYRGRTGPIYIPASLAAVVEGVFGLDNRPQTTPHFRPAPDPHAARAFTAIEVAQLYDFAFGADGAGQAIAIIELGGGYRQADLDTYFKQLRISSPNITAVSVDGGQNQPTGSPNSADGEVVLDIEIAGAIAPKAHIMVYFAPNTDQGFLDAVTTAAHDAQNKPSVISISWGAPESSWTDQAMRAFDSACQAAGMLGVTVCCASGDNGSSDGVNDGLAHVDFPASSPHVLGCGGTHLESSAGMISEEGVWNGGTAGGATGGGISDVFDLPSWQQNANVPRSVNPGGRIGRGVPDVAGDADPATGFRILVDGQQAVFGGTSAVAPLWAGLIALINQKLAQPAGFINPLLYNRVRSSGAFHDITNGNNGAYMARPGWDACTGLGTPDGARLQRALSAGTAAPRSY